MPATCKTHAVTFRLGAGDYEQLVKTVANTGARSLSDFTRSAVLNSMVNESIDSLVREELDRITNILNEFDTKLRDLRRQLKHLTMNSGIPSN